MSCMICLTVIFFIVLYTILSTIFQPFLRFVFYVFNSKKAIPMYKRFGEWAVITGGSDGIGEAIALELARRKMKLLLIARSLERLETTRQRIIEKTKIDVHIEIFAFDFSEVNWLENEGYQKLTAILIERDIGILVNNVGMSYPSAQEFDELSSKMLDDILFVNLRSVFHLTHMILPGMRKRCRGAILSIGSGASELPTDPLYAAYASVKSAVQSFCSSLQVECVKDNILVQCQTPLLVCTKLSKIRISSLTVLTPEKYAHDSICSLEKTTPNYWIDTTHSPNSIHHTILCMINILPLGIWNLYRLKMTSAIRHRYIMKTKKK